MQIRHIVAGLEFGGLSDHAVARAMGLAREFEARLDVVHGAGLALPHVAAPRREFFAEHAERLRSQALARAREKVSAIAKKAAYSTGPLEEWIHVEEAAGSQALLSFANEKGADLIVMGAHRRRKLFDFGSTGRGVLARSHCPVWVEPAEERRFERVLAPIDLSSSTALVLQAARALAARFVVPVRVLHVFMPPEFAYDEAYGPGPTYTVDALREQEHAAASELVSTFDWGELPVEIDHAEGDPAEQILEHAGESDLIVMGTHGHGALARAVLGSCAYGVLKRAQVPMLVVPQDKSHYAQVPG